MAVNDTLAARLAAIPVCLIDVDCKPMTGGDVAAMRLWKVSIRIHDNPIVEMDMFYASKTHFDIPAIYEIAKEYIDREYNDEDPYLANVQGVLELDQAVILP